MPFKIVRSDLAAMQADAIVNTANPNPIVGSGVDSELHRAAGPELLEARKKIGRIAPGGAALTPAFRLNARYVIHTVGPVWRGGAQGEEQTLASCYRNSLELAAKHRCESLAFPLISTGNYGFPKPLALQIAVREISSFLLENELLVYLVVYDGESFALSEKLFSDVRSYIDENYIQSRAHGEHHRRYASANRPESDFQPILRSQDFLLAESAEAPEADAALPLGAALSLGEAQPAAEPDWGSLLRTLDAGFSETLLRLIDRSGKKDSEVYKRANVDRKLFSKIRNNPDYKPSKTTALAFAFALELDLGETKDLISRAGYALSHSSKFDVIVEYFLVNRKYDLFELNEVLFAFDQPLLGA